MTEARDIVDVLAEKLRRRILVRLLSLDETEIRSWPNTPEVHKDPWREDIRATGIVELVGTLKEAREYVLLLTEHFDHSPADVMVDRIDSALASITKEGKDA